MSACLRIRERRGAALLVVLLWLPILLAGAALILDGGQLLLARHRLQASVDLAALAAVQSLDWDRLAEGEVTIIEDEAEEMARQYLSDNLVAMTGRGFEEFRVWVINANPEDPKVHPVTGEGVYHPTVVLRCQLRGPSSWFGAWKEAPVLEAEADASLRPRGED